MCQLRDQKKTMHVLQKNISPVIAKLINAASRALMTYAMKIHLIYFSANYMKQLLKCRNTRMRVSNENTRCCLRENYSPAMSGNKKKTYLRTDTEQRYPMTIQE
uniref:Uncharacterized protein LOC111113074 n=1 Tax=Crassostrea virginica TaxID=6565 RepID=A0A8B8BV36_CRAVI|nr:uncharacterized protein LOC111113074 [Crassostrea virginica]